MPRTPSPQKKHNPQLPIDFNRASQLAILQHAELPVPEVDGQRLKTSPAAMKAVLLAIDGACGNVDVWQLKYATIAERTGLSRPTVIRAVGALVALGVIRRVHNKRSGWRAAHYGICWPNLKDFDRRAKPPEVSSLQPPASPASDHGEHSEYSQGADRVIMVSTPSDHGDHSSIPSIRPDHLPDPSSRPRPPEKFSDQNNFVSDERRNQLPSPLEGEGTGVRGPNQHAVTIARRLGIRPQSPPADVSLAAKVGLLIARGKISEHEAYDALEAATARQRKNLRAYFHTSLDAKLGGNLNVLLATIPDPTGRRR